MNNFTNKTVPMQGMPPGFISSVPLSISSASVASSSSSNHIIPQQMHQFGQFHSPLQVTTSIHQQQQQRPMLYQQQQQHQFIPGSGAKLVPPHQIQFQFPPDGGFQPLPPHPQQFIPPPTAAHTGSNHHHQQQHQHQQASVPLYSQRSPAHMVQYSHQNQNHAPFQQDHNIPQHYPQLQQSPLSMSQHLSIGHQSQQQQQPQQHFQPPQQQQQMHHIVHEHHTQPHQIQQYQLQPQQHSQLQPSPRSTTSSLHKNVNNNNNNNNNNNLVMEYSAPVRSSRHQRNANAVQNNSSGQYQVPSTTNNTNTAALSTGTSSSRTSLTTTASSSSFTDSGHIPTNGKPKQSAKITVMMPQRQVPRICSTITPLAPNTLHISDPQGILQLPHHKIDHRTHINQHLTLQQQIHFLRHMKLALQLSKTIPKCVPTAVVFISPEIAQQMVTATKSHVDKYAQDLIVKNNAPPGVVMATNMTNDPTLERIFTTVSPRLSVFDHHPVHYDYTNPNLHYSQYRLYHLPSWNHLAHVDKLQRFYNGAQILLYCDTLLPNEDGSISVQYNDANMNNIVQNTSAPSPSSHSSSLSQSASTSLTPTTGKTTLAVQQQPISTSPTGAISSLTEAYSNPNLFARTSPKLPPNPPVTPIFLEDWLTPYNLRLLVEPYCTKRYESIPPDLPPPINSQQQPYNVYKRLVELYHQRQAGNNISDDVLTISNSNISTTPTQSTTTITKSRGQRVVGTVPQTVTLPSSTWDDELNAMIDKHHSTTPPSIPLLPPADTALYNQLLTKNVKDYTLKDKDAEKRFAPIQTAIMNTYYDESLRDFGNEELSLYQHSIILSFLRQQLIWLSEIIKPHLDSCLPISNNNSDQDYVPPSFVNQPIPQNTMIDPDNDEIDDHLKTSTTSKLDPTTNSLTIDSSVSLVDDAKKQTLQQQSEKINQLKSDIYTTNTTLQQHPRYPLESHPYYLPSSEQQVYSEPGDHEFESFRPLLQSFLPFFPFDFKFSRRLAPRVFDSLPEIPNDELQTELLQSLLAPTILTADNQISHQHFTAADPMLSSTAAAMKSNAPPNIYMDGVPADIFVVCERSLRFMPLPLTEIPQTYMNPSQQQSSLLHAIHHLHNAQLSTNNQQGINNDTNMVITPANNTTHTNFSDFDQRSSELIAESPTMKKATIQKSGKKLKTTTLSPNSSTTLNRSSTLSSMEMNNASLKTSLSPNNTEDSILQPTFYGLAQLPTQASTLLHLSSPVHPQLYPPHYYALTNQPERTHPSLQQPTAPNSNYNSTIGNSNLVNEESKSGDSIETVQNLLVGVPLQPNQRIFYKYNLRSVVYEFMVYTFELINYLRLIRDCVAYDFNLEYTKQLHTALAQYGTYEAIPLHHTITFDRFNFDELGQFVDAGYNATPVQFSAETISHYPDGINSPLPPEIENASPQIQLFYKQLTPTSYAQRGSIGSIDTYHKEQIQANNIPKPLHVQISMRDQPAHLSQHLAMLYPGRFSFDLRPLDDHEVAFICGVSRKIFEMFYSDHHHDVLTYFYERVTYDNPHGFTDLTLKSILNGSCTARDVVYRRWRSFTPGCPIKTLWLKRRMVNNYEPIPRMFYTPLRKYELFQTITCKKTKAATHPPISLETGGGGLLPYLSPQSIRNMIRGGQYSAGVLPLSRIEFFYIYGTIHYELLIVQHRPKVRSQLEFLHRLNITSEDHLVSIVQNHQQDIDTVPQENLLVSEQLFPPLPPNDNFHGLTEKEQLEIVKLQSMVSRTHKSLQYLKNRWLKRASSHTHPLYENWVLARLDSERPAVPLDVWCLYYINLVKLIRDFPELMVYILCEEEEYINLMHIFTPHELVALSQPQTAIDFVDYAQSYQNYLVESDSTSTNHTNDCQVPLLPPQPSKLLAETNFHLTDLVTRYQTWSQTKLSIKAQRLTSPVDTLRVYPYLLRVVLNDLSAKKLHECLAKNPILAKIKLFCDYTLKRPLEPTTPNSASQPSIDVLSYQPLDQQQSDATSTQPLEQTLNSSLPPASAEIVAPFDIELPTLDYSLLGTVAPPAPVAKSVAQAAINHNALLIATKRRTAPGLNEPVTTSPATSFNSLSNNSNTNDFAPSTIDDITTNHKRARYRQ